ncbi:MAG TPA: glycosyltransferase [Hyphomicrobiaceae bacterium]|jgi:GT2 family glycosyltransferase
MPPPELTPKPQATVIVPHLNQPGMLQVCLGSLDAQSVGPGAFEVIVVDNGSAELPTAIVGRHPNVRLLQEQLPGPGLARNRGAGAALGGILCFIDADCRAHPRWLEQALKTLAAAPPGTVLGGDVQIWREAGTRITAVEAYESVFAYRFKLYIERHGYSGTGNLIVRRADFEKVGPFRGLDVAEDMDWGRRARAAGLTIRYEPGMIVYHPARSSLRELLVKWDRHVQHDLNGARTRPWWQVRWLGRACLVLASPLVDAAKAVVSDRLRGWPARLKAIAVLAAVRGYRAWRMLTLPFSSQRVVWNRPAESARPRTDAR